MLKDWTDFKFRCSSLGRITSVGRGAVLTEKQKEELQTLLSKIQLTPKQAERRNELQEKANSKPDLSQGAKTYLQQLWKEHTFGRYKEFDNKYTQKGTEQEYVSLKLANSVLGWGLTEDYIDGLEFRKDRLTDDLVTGEMDLNYEYHHFVADVKSPWDIHTFPHFGRDIPTEDYFWQGQGYLRLSGKRTFKLVYCLVNTPERIILDEIRRREWQQGYIEIPDEEEDQIRKNLTYDDIADEYKVREWTIHWDDEAQERIELCVQLAREYLSGLNLEFELNFLNNHKTIKL